MINHPPNDNEALQKDQSSQLDHQLSPSPSRSLSPSSSSSSSNRTIIEPSQHQIPSQDLLNQPQLETQSDNSSDHERRLRLIDANRIMTGLAEDETDVPLQQQQSIDQRKTVRIEILLSSINSKKAFEFEPQSTILEIKNHLLKSWPHDWIRKDTPVLNHLDQLKMVYMGKCPNDRESLNSLGGLHPIIIHLVVKPSAEAIEQVSGTKEPEVVEGCWPFCCLRMRRRNRTRNTEQRQSTPRHGYLFC